MVVTEYRVSRKMYVGPHKDKGIQELTGPKEEPAGLVYIQ